MKNVEITQALLSKLTFEPFVRSDDRLADKDRAFRPGNVVQVKRDSRYRSFDECADNEYVLIGHVNDSGGFCDDCSVYIDEVVAIAHISEIFDPAFVERMQG